MPTRPAPLNSRSCRSADGWWTQSSIRSIERRSFWKRWPASKSTKAISSVTSRSFELWCRIVLNTLPSRTNRSSCAWSWTRSWSRTGELMCTTTLRFLDLPPRGKKKCQPISICVTHIMNRLKALYRGWGIPCAGTQVYAPRYREQWLNKIRQAGVRRRAELFYQHLDGLQVLRRQVRGEFLAESRKHKAVKVLRQIPCIGPIRAARLLALMQTPHRFRSKRQLWTYSGLGVETHDSAQHCYVDGRLQRSKKPQQIRGLNQNHNHEMKEIFKSTAMSASRCAGPFGDVYAGLLTKGMKPEMARLTLARKIAAITLTLWKKGASFDAEYVKPQAA